MGAAFSVVTVATVVAWRDAWVTDGRISWRLGAHLGPLSWQARPVDRPLLVLSADELDQHRNPRGHPEHHGRLAAALAGIDAADLTAAVDWREPRLVNRAELGLVHSERHIALIEQISAEGGGQIDADTGVAPGSWDTARRSAGAVLDAIDALQAGECEIALAAGRPPGHHATPDRAMGFCLFNNVAIGAASLAQAGERVAIVDWDVHHGNGSQDIFYDNPDVLYVSTHESPQYPGTGKMHETGDGRGVGTTVNLPFPPGTAGDVFRQAFDEIVIPVIERFEPDWLFISAGYDGHRNDPLGGLGLTAADYADLATRLLPLVPAARLIVALEGGYDLDALTTGVGATMSALVGEHYRPEPASGGDIGVATVQAARQLWELG